MGSQPQLLRVSRLHAIRKFLRKKNNYETESNNSKVYLDQEELNTLVKEVKETVAADISIKKEKYK